FV
ncbi:hypothetical protein BVRB_018110, partial [Beta vulgaris subsp. vulgaris]